MTKKPAFHAIKVMRSHLDAGNVARFGSDVFALLAAVGLTEDRTGYRGPVAFWNSHLAQILGWSQKKMKRVRRRAIEAGVLEYQAGSRHKAPEYRIASGDTLSPRRDREGTAKGTAKGPRRGLHSSLIPKPDTFPPRKAPRGEVDDDSEKLLQGALTDWENHVRELGKAPAGFSGQQRRAIEEKAAQFHAAIAVKIIRNHIERGRFTLTWPDMPQHKEPSRESQIESIRFRLIRDFGLNEARDWDASRVSSEYHALIANGHDNP